MDMPTAEEPRTVADHTRWLRRRWWVVVLVVLLGALATAALTSRQEKVYTATTSVLVTPTGVGTGDAQPTGVRTNSGLNLDTEAKLVKSLVVADGARQLLKSPAAEDALAARVTVAVPPNTQILDITFAAATPAEAQAGSHGFAQAYLDQRAGKARQDLSAQVNSLREQQTALNKQLQDLAGRVASLPSNSVDRQRAESQLGVVSNQLSNLGARLSPLVATAITPGSIISDAELPRRASEPNLVRNYGAGIGGALLLGLALALLLDRLDTRVWRASEVSGRFGLPVLLQLPRRAKTPSVATAGSPTGRDFSRLRIALASELRTSGRSAEDAHMVVVTAAARGRGSGMVTANLAAARDRSGLPVLVICLDPSSWTLTALGVAPGPGLADVLRGDAMVVDASSPAAGLPDVRVMGPGTSTGAPGEELRSDLIAELVGQLREWGGYILFEAPPPQDSVDGQVLAGHADAVLLVVELKRSRTTEVADAVARFEEVRAALLGLVVVPDFGRPSSSTAAPAQRSEPARPTPRVESTLPAPRVESTLPVQRVGTAEGPPRVYAPPPGVEEPSGDGAGTDPMPVLPSPAAGAVAYARPVVGRAAVETAGRAHGAKDDTIERPVVTPGQGTDDGPGTTPERRPGVARRPSPGPGAGTSPSGATANGASPSGATVQSTSSSGATGNGATPNGATGNGATPNGAPRNGATPNGATANGASPSGATANGATRPPAAGDAVASTGARKRLPWRDR